MSKHTRVEGSGGMLPQEILATDLNRVRALKSTSE